LIASRPSCAPRVPFSGQRRVLAQAASCGVLLGVWVHAAGQLPSARLDQVFPAGGQAGSQLDVVARGNDLDSPRELLFSSPHITAQVLTNSSPGEPATPTAARFRVVVDADARPGIYDARLAGRFGVSNPRAFVVGPFAEAIGNGTNHTAATAQRVGVGTTTNGRVAASHADWYVFTARAGQRLLIECLGRRIDSRLDPVVVLATTRGKELARSRNGDLVDYTAATDGDLTVTVFDELSLGGENHFYRLTIHDGPHVDLIMPPIWLPGERGRHAVFGRNLPGASRVEGLSAGGKPLDRLDVDIDWPPRRTADSAAPQGWLPAAPASLGVEGFPYHLATARGVANPYWLTFAHAPVLEAREPNDDPWQATKVQLPCEVAGQLYPGVDRDWFEFEARKGDVLWIEIVSQRLGSGTDPMVLCERALPSTADGQPKSADAAEHYDSDANPGGREFKLSSMDPVFRFEVKDDGPHRVLVRDQAFKARPDARRLYQLSIRKQTPGFSLAALPMAPPPANRDSKEMRLASLLLRRGSTAPVRVIARRRDGFDGEIRLAAEGLPDGVTCPETILRAGATTATLLLNAAAQAVDWAGPIRIQGRADIGGSQVIEDATAGTLMWDVGNYESEMIPSRRVARPYLGVCGTEETPFQLIAGTGATLETSVAGTVRVPVNVVRRGELIGSAKLSLGGHDALGIKELDLDVKATNAVFDVNLAESKLPAGMHQLYVFARAQVRYQKSESDARAAEAALKEAERIHAELTAESSKLAQAAQQAAKATAALEQTVSDLQKQFESKPKPGEPATAAPAAPRSTLTVELATAREMLARATDSKRTADAAAGEAATKTTEAAKRKDQAAERAKAAAKRELSEVFYSPPLALRVLPAPLTLTLATQRLETTRGRAVDLDATIARLFGFADAVALALDGPQDAKGVRASGITIAKEETQGRLRIEVAAELAAGEYSATVRAAVKFNGQDLHLDQPLTLVIRAEPASTP
jgi:hypothetical protein